MLVEFSLTCIFHHVWEIFFQFMVFTLLENSLNRFLLMPQFFTQNSWQDFVKVFFPQDEIGGENYDLLYQNSIRKHGDDFEHKVIYIFYDL